MHATTINRDMLIAASRALWQSTLPVELSPNPLDLSLHQRVAYEVGKAAVATGVGEEDGLEQLEP